VKKGFLSSLAYLSLVFLVTTGIVAVYTIWNIASNQNAILKVVALELDFDEKASYTIGGKGYLPGVELVPQNADIRFPINSLINNFGSFSFDKPTQTIRFRANANICSEKYSDVQNATNCVLYPQVLGTDGNIIAPNTQVVVDMDKALIINYPLGKLRLWFKVENNKLLLFFDGKNINPRILLPMYSEQSCSFDVRVNKAADGFQKETVANQLLDVDFGYGAPRYFQQTIKKASHKIDSNATYHLSNTHFYFTIVGITAWRMWGSIIIIFLFCLLSFWLSLKVVNRIDEKSKSYILELLFSVLQILFTALYFLGIALYCHYSGATGKDERFWALFVGGIAILSMLSIINGRKNKCVSWLLNWLSSTVQKLYKLTKLDLVGKNEWLVYVVIVVTCAILGVAITFGGSGERLLGLPALFFGRLFLTLIVFIAFSIIQSTKNKKRMPWLYLFLFAGVLFFGICSKDIGSLIILSFSTFLLLLIFDFSLFKEKWLSILGVGLILILIIGLFSFVSPNLVKKFGRVELTYYLVNSIDDESISSADRESTLKHVKLLEFINNSFYPKTDLVLPSGMLTVIHTDYVLLYSGLLFGKIVGYYGVIVIICLISFVFVRLVFHASTFNVDAEELNSVRAIAFIYLGYAVQMLYMALAISRIVPLTGQSIPFLALSITEPGLFFVYFALGLVIFVHLRRSERPLAIDIPNPVKEHFSKTAEEDIPRDLLEKGDTLKKVQNPNFTDNNNIKQLKYIGKISALILALLFGLIVMCPNTDIKDKYSLKRSYSSSDQKTFNKFLNIGKNFETSLSKRQLLEIVDTLSFEEGTNKKQLVKLLQKDIWSIEGKLTRNNMSGGAAFVSDSIKLLPHHVDLSKFASNLSNVKAVMTQGEILAEMPINFSVSTSNDDSLQVASPLLNDYEYLNIKMTALNDTNATDTTFFLIAERRINNRIEKFYHNAQYLSQLPDQDDLKSINKATLTLNPLTNYISTQLLKSFCESKTIPAASIVVIENQTGHIKVMASYPSLPADATQIEINQNVENLKELEVYRKPNLPIAATWYRPGSTIKPLLLYAANLRRGKTYYCNKTSRELIECEGRHGNTTINSFMARSCNHFSQLMLRDVYADSTKRLDFEGTISDILNENYEHNETDFVNVYDKYKLSLPTENEPRKLNLAGVGGGDNKFSPLFAATAFARLVSGNNVKPVLYNVGGYADFETITEHNRLMPVKTALEKVIDYKNGTARALNGKGFEYAKTGTAGDLDDSSRTHSWLLAANDEITLAVFLYNKGENESTSATRFINEYWLPMKNNITNPF